MCLVLISVESSWAQLNPTTKLLMKSLRSARKTDLVGYQMMRARIRSSRAGSLDALTSALYKVGTLPPGSIPPHMTVFEHFMPTLYNRAEVRWAMFENNESGWAFYDLQPFSRSYESVMHKMHVSGSTMAQTRDLADYTGMLVARNLTGWSGQLKIPARPFDFGRPEFMTIYHSSTAYLNRLSDQINDYAVLKGYSGRSFLVDADKMSSGAPAFLSEVSGHDSRIYPLKKMATNWTEINSTLRSNRGTNAYIAYLLSIF